MLMAISNLTPEKKVLPVMEMQELFSSLHWFLSSFQMVEEMLETYSKEAKSAADSQEEEAFEEDLEIVSKLLILCTGNRKNSTVYSAFS